MSRIAVLGVGLIGGSIGLAARRAGDVTVAGWDPDERALARALELEAIDEQSGSLEQAVAGAEACFVCAPVGRLAPTARAALECGGDCVVTDVGSVKAAVLEELSGADLERFVGGHPLAGAEASGVEHARPDLFEGATWCHRARRAAVRDRGGRP
jgi:prephenate dehydrogenase